MSDISNPEEINHNLDEESDFDQQDLTESLGTCLVEEIISPEKSNPPQSLTSDLEFLWSKPKLLHDPYLPLRLREKQEEANEKLAKLIEQKEAEIDRLCPFKPDISDLSHRSFNEFWLTQIDFQKARVSKLNSQIEERERQVSTFKPSLCEKSEKIVHRLRESVIEETHRKAKSMVTAETATPQFHPKVNPRSQKLKRPDSISDHLYNDALRRQIEPPKFEVMKQKKLSRSSQKCLINRFITEFNVHFNELKVPKTDLICYSLYIVLLKRMHFVQNDLKSPNHREERYLIWLAWDSFEKRRPLFVHREFLFAFLMNVMGFEQPRDTRYTLFFNNREAARRKPRTIHQSLYSFKPNLNQKSLKLAKKKHALRGDSLNFLTGERHNNQEKFKMIQMDRDHDELKNLTFNPSINQLRSMGARYKEGSMAGYWKKMQHGKDRAVRLFALAQTMQDKPDQCNFEDLSECTFNPKITRYQEKQPQTDLCEEKKVVVNPLQNQTVQSEEYSETESEEDEPLTVAVYLPSGKLEYMVIRSSDDRALVVDRFIVQHGLNGLVARQLKQGVLAA